MVVMDPKLPEHYTKHSAVSSINQSEPIDLDKPYDAANVKGKTIVITGGASGFGAGFVRKWALNGATIVIGDINEELSQKLVAEVRKDTGNEDVHFVHCNVCDWLSQVRFFKEAARLSPHGGIDMVVANAGIAGADDFEMCVNRAEKLAAGTYKAPPKPNLKTLEVNLIGVLYTTHLALFWLQRNPGSRPSSRTATGSPRDRHLLLLGSMASLAPIPAQVLYGVSKHGVLGLFRTLRSTAFIHGIRVNMLLPYFIDTPIVPASVRVLLAGGAMGKPEDVVEAATRFAADTTIIGRSLYIGPKMRVVQDAEGVTQLAVKHGSPGVATRAVWEAYAHDFDDAELFNRNLTRLLNRFAILRGWSGWFMDLVRAVRYGLSSSKKAIVSKQRAAE